jgi:hypothetical protein
MYNILYKIKLMKQKKIDEIILEIYDVLYKNAEPSADFRQLIEDGETVKPFWFMNYYLSDDEQEAIIEEVLTKHKIKDKYKRRSFKLSVMLGCSPTSTKKEIK